MGIQCQVQSSLKVADYGFSIRVPAALRHALCDALDDIIANTQSVQFRDERQNVLKVLNVRFADLFSVLNCGHNLCHIGGQLGDILRVEVQLHAGVQRLQPSRGINQIR